MKSCWWVKGYSSLRGKNHQETLAVTLSHFPLHLPFQSPTAHSVPFRLTYFSEKKPSSHKALSHYASALSRNTKTTSDQITVAHPTKGKKTKQKQKPGLHFSLSKDPCLKKK